MLSPTRPLAEWSPTTMKTIFRRYTEPKNRQICFWFWWSIFLRTAMGGNYLPDGSFTGDGVKQRIRQKLLEDCNVHTIIRLPNSVFKPYATVATNLVFFTKGSPTKKFGITNTFARQKLRLIQRLSLLITMTLRLLEVGGPMGSIATTHGASPLMR